jgi:topoisomerase-4 subunit A
MRKDEFAFNCSDIDEIIVFRKDGKVVVTKVDKKTFVGKNIIHLAVFKKKDDRTTYNMIYTNGVTKNSYMKRFNITSSTRDKEYDLTKNGKGEVLYLTSNPNGEAEKVTVHLRALQRLKKLKLDVDFSELAIKGKLSMGNLVCKSPIKKIELKEAGVSTLSARKIWFDEVINKLNTEERGKYLGEFEADDKILVVQKSGLLQLLNFDLGRHFNDDILLIEKCKPENPLTAIYFDASKECYYVKRFIPVSSDKSTTIISESKGSFLEIITSHPSPELNVSFVKERGKDRKEENFILNDFIAVKGEKAQGNKLSPKKVHKLNLIEKEIENVPEEKTDDVIENVVRNDDSDESKTDSESDTKIIIDEDSTDNQFKLEL